MMMLIRNMVIGGMLMLATVVGSVPSAQAASPGMPGLGVATGSDIQLVNDRYRYRYRSFHDNGRYGRYDGYSRYSRPGVSIYIAPRAIYRQPVVRRGYSAHVNWCLSRYRSYDPATNRFIAYGGIYKVCRSPYR